MSDETPEDSKAYIFESVESFDARVEKHLLDAYERGRKAGLEEAAQHIECDGLCGGNCAAARHVAEIRALIEKGAKT